MSPLRLNPNGGRERTPRHRCWPAPTGLASGPVDRFRRGWHRLGHGLKRWAAAERCFP
jgi:hypothetical protein